MSKQQPQQSPVGQQPPAPLGGTQPTGPASPQPSLVPPSIVKVSGLTFERGSDVVVLSVLDAGVTSQRTLDFNGAGDEAQVAATLAVIPQAGYDEDNDELAVELEADPAQALPAGGDQPIFKQLDGNQVTLEIAGSDQDAFLNDANEALGLANGLIAAERNNATLAKTSLMVDSRRSRIFLTHDVPSPS